MQAKTIQSTVSKKTYNFVIKPCTCNNLFSKET